MSRYTRDDGTEFDNYDDAWEDAMQQMDQPDFFERFEDRVSYWTLLQWATQQPHFYDDFGDCIADVEQSYFDDKYWEVEDENP